MNKSILPILLFSVFLMSSLGAQEAQEIVAKTYKVYKSQGDDGITIANMNLKNSDGKIIMNRELVLMKKNVKGSNAQKWYAYFKRPADIRKMVFMVWKNENKDDDRWVFLPAMDLVKRLAGSDKRSSFAGSQFVYEDVTGRYPSMDTHELIAETDSHYQIKSTPKDAGDVEFSYFETFVDKTNYVPTKRVFYDKKGTKQREFRVAKVEVIQGLTSIMEFSMTNLQTGESTYTTFSDLRYNVGLPDSIFEESYLRRAPRKWLRYNK